MLRRSGIHSRSVVLLQTSVLLAFAAILLALVVRGEGQRNDIAARQNDNRVSTSP